MVATGYIEDGVSCWSGFVMDSVEKKVETCIRWLEVWKVVLFAVKKMEFIAGQAWTSCYCRSRFIWGFSMKGARWRLDVVDAI